MKHRIARAVVAAAVGGTVLLGVGVAGSASYRSEPKPKPAGPSITASPSSVVEESVDGGIGFAVTGRGFFSTEAVTVSSPGLSTACSSGLFWAGSGSAGNDTITVTTDFSGMFNVAAVADGCAPGTYKVFATENATPNRTATTSVTVLSPRPGGPRFVLSPSSQTETGTSGSVATTLLIQGLNPDETVTVSSPSLVAACPGGVHLFERGTGFPTLPGTATTDFAGNANLALTADGCHAGTYPITVTETGAGHRSFTASFTIRRP